MPNQPLRKTLRERRNRSTKKRRKGLGTGGQGHPPSNKGVKDLEYKLTWIINQGPDKFRYPSIAWPWYNKTVEHFCYECGIGWVEWIVCNCKWEQAESDKVDMDLDELYKELGI